MSSSSTTTRLILILFISLLSFQCYLCGGGGGGQDGKRGEKKEKKEFTPIPHITSISKTPFYLRTKSRLNLYQDEECLENSINDKCADTITDNQDELRARLKEFDKLETEHLLNYEIEGLNSTDSISDESYKTLKQVLLIHRHGDRTPIQFPPKDPLKNEPFWEFHGYGQLTNRGKARVFLLGKIIRNRYDKFLGKSVNKNQILSRSSGALRCIESAQMFLAGFLALNHAGSSDAQELIWDNNKNPLAHLWQPSAIVSLPAVIDGMLAEGAQCDALKDEYDLIDKSDFVQQINKSYQHEADVMKEILGFDIDHYYKWFWGSSQIEVEREYFENKMNPKILEIYDRMQEAGNLALGAFQSTLLAKRLRSGLLISDMVSNMKHVRDLKRKIDTGGDTTVDKKRLIHYSAHDLTLILLLGMFDQWDKFPFRPEYASNILLELHYDSEQDEWFVKIFYQPEVPATLVQLHPDKCEQGNPRARCSLDKFAEMVEPYMIPDWMTWMKECKNDMSKINPYYRDH